MMNQYSSTIFNQPMAFKFKPGAKICYIDFNDEDNSKPGKIDHSRKHHKWDSAAKEKFAINEDTNTFLCGQRQNTTGLPVDE